ADRRAGRADPDRARHLRGLPGRAGRPAERAHRAGAGLPPAGLARGRRDRGRHAPAAAARRPGAAAAVTAVMCAARRPAGLDGAMTSTTTAPTVTLPHGAEMPRLGLGTWPMDDGAAEVTVATAIELGYRLFDTAENYGNERGVGRGLKASG